MEDVLVSRRMWCCDKCSRGVMVPYGFRPCRVVCDGHGGPAHVVVHTGIKFVQTTNDRWVAIL